MQSALFTPLRLTGATSSKIPAYLYGCAWKKDETADLVYKALCSGFKGIDVAAQPKHYREDLAGEGVRRAIAEGVVRREDLFIQTKFSPVSAHDPSNIPYNSRSPIPTQVQISINSSLHNLRTSSSPSPSQPGDPADHTKDTTYLDSVLLHSPLGNLPDTLSAWKTLESYVSGGQIKNLGISNTPLPILKALWENVDIKPAVVQNRFCREEGGGYDQEVRRFCRENGIVYQSFWTLSANPQLLKHTSVQRLAGLCSISREVALYALVLGLDGTCILNGTKNHMVEDVTGLEKVMYWVGEEENAYEWQDVLKHFKDATGDNNPEEMPVESADGTKHVRTRERRM